MAAVRTPNSKNGGGLLNRLARSEEFFLIVFLLLLGTFFAWRSPYFGQIQTLWDVLREVSLNAISGIGITILILAGEFDLSIGSMLAFVSVIVVQVINITGNMYLGILAGLLAGLVVGLTHAMLVTKARMNSLMVTLGTMFFLRGLVYLYTNKSPMVMNDWIPAFEDLWFAGLGPVPLPAVIFLVLALLAYYILKYRPFGRYVYAAGRNAQAARLAGIDADRVKFFCFIICSLLASISGILIAAQTSTGYFDAGATGFELNVIAAVVLGGVSLAGGSGSVWGALLGILILGVTGKGMRLMNIYTTWQLFVTGAVLVLAVYIHQFRSSSKRRLGLQRPV